MTSRLIVTYEWYFDLAIMICKYGGDYYASNFLGLFSKMRNLHRYNHLLGINNTADLCAVVFQIFVCRAPMTEEKRPMFGSRHLSDEQDVFSHNAW